MCANRAKAIRHSPKTNIRSRAWQIANRERDNKRRKVYYKNNKARLALKSKLWTAANPEKFRDIQAKSRKKKLAEWKAAVFAKLGEVCVRCGESRVPVLSIDHVKGDGAAERKIDGRDRRKLYMRVINDVEGRYQILCMNCQWMKRHDNKEFFVMPSKNSAIVSNGGV